MCDNKKAEQKKKQTIMSSLAIKREAHLKVIQNQVDEAKDPSSYETYDYGISEAEESIKLFAARRKGISHIINKTPCQDFCLTTSINGCTILADADGVSSCEYSDIGSRFACEAVVLAVKLASKSCSGEEQLVSRLLSVSFRDRLVSIWIEKVLEEISHKGNNLTPKDQLSEFVKYGSTIMFAVITAHWIVVGNLGDGQILVFNDCFGVKLRVHAPKDSSKVRCLVNERCAREDFQVAKFPRNCFNGILLSSDGIYESMDKSNHFFNYCIQMKKRFLERTPNEPYQAFCYKEDGEPYKDFSRMRTDDDCSIAMAIDEREIVSDYETIKNSILQHSQAALFKRWSPDCMSFYTKMNDTYADVLVSKLNNDTFLPDDLKTAILDLPKNTWSEEGMLFNEYKEDENLSTIEFLHCSGMLRRDRSNPSESEQMILNLYLQIRRVKKELSKLGLEFNSSVPFNVAYDGKALHVRKEAIKNRENGLTKDKTDYLELCFSHLLGVIESDNRMIPLFDFGYIDKGPKHYRTRTGHNSEELLQLLRKDNKIHLKNISSYTWSFDDGNLLLPDESLELNKTLKFTLLGEHEKELEHYSYVSKEFL